MKTPALFAVILALFSSALLAIEADQMRALGMAMMEFAKKPSETAFRAFESQASGLPKLDETGEDRHPMLLTAVFLARASETHKWPITGESQIGKQAQQILSGKGDLAKYVQDDTQLDSSKLDVWWVSYMATQDKAYLEKVLKYAGNRNPANAIEAALAGAATWSFKSNCQQFEGVRKFAERCLKDPAYQKKHKFLESCLNPAP